LHRIEHYHSIRQSESIRIDFSQLTADMVRYSVSVVVTVAIFSYRHMPILHTD